MMFRTQLINYFDEYNDESIQILCSEIISMLLANCDFFMFSDEMDQRIIAEIEEETGGKIHYAPDTIIGEESLAIYNRAREVEDSEQELTRQEQIELIADILSDDTLFEGLCVVFFGNDDLLLEMMQDFGCSERYQVLQGDSVYRKRREYFKAINDCVIASLNLYGVINGEEMVRVIEHYNSFDKSGIGYQRSEGSYRNTIMFDPQYLCEASLQELVGIGVQLACVALDGMMAHHCFMDEYAKESRGLMELFNRPYSDQELFDFLEGPDSGAYRRLYRAAVIKPMYLPEREEFLRYIDEDYYEMSEEEVQLQTYLVQNYGHVIERKAAKGMVTTDDRIEEMMWEFHKESSDMGWSDLDRDPQAGLRYIVDKLQEYGASITSLEELNRLSAQVILAVNSVKQWYNHGYSPNEVRRLMAPKRNEGKRVYPNDPCPCGSGKKYKKCCGK